MTTPPEPTPPTPAEPPADKTFTQADLDRIVADRLARQKAQFGDYDALKAKAAEFDQMAEQNRTEAEKAVAAARKEGFTEAQQRANDRYLKAKVHALAAKDFADPADAVRLADLSKYQPDENGEFDEAAIMADLAETLQAKPYLAAQSPGFQGSGGGGPRGARPGTGPTLPQLIAEAERSGNTRESMRLKARYAREQRKQG